MYEIRILNRAGMLIRSWWHPVGRPLVRAIQKVERMGYTVLSQPDMDS